MKQESSREGELFTVHLAQSKHYGFKDCLHGSLYLVLLLRSELLLQVENGLFILSCLSLNVRRDYSPKKNDHTQLLACMASLESSFRGGEKPTVLEFMRCRLGDLPCYLSVWLWVSHLPFLVSASSFVKRIRMSAF